MTTDKTREGKQATTSVQREPFDSKGGGNEVAHTGQDVDGAKEHSAIETDAQGPATGKAESIEALQQTIASLEDSLLRAKAECQNILRRAAAEKIEAVTYANAGLMQSLVGVLDDFDRTLEAGEGADTKSVVEGVRLVHANLAKALQDHGLTQIAALHQPFDPHVHEAMLQQPSADHPAGTVLQELATGYKLRERVIRPAKVVVAKAVDDGERQSADSGRGES